jgi:hypothetical protein
MGPLCWRACACPKTTNVTFLTAHAQPKALLQFKSFGAEGIILRPFDPTTLAV